MSVERSEADIGLADFNRSDFEPSLILWTKNAPEWRAWLLMSAVTCDLAVSRLAPLLVPFLGRAVLARLDQHHLRYPVRLVILRSLRLQRQLRGADMDLARER